MDLKQLSYFIAVYEKGSINGAAKACFIAQPSISHAIAQLESELAQPLFIRHSKGVAPTERGEQLYPLAKQMIGQAQAIKASFSQATSKRAFRLGVTKGLGVKRMSVLLKSFISQQTDMELTLVPPEDNCDARIVTKEELDTNESFHPIWQEDYLLALPMQHPLSLKDTITLTDLDQLDFIQRTPCSAWQRLNDTLTLSGYQVSIRAKIQTIDYAIGLVKAGLGGALVPAHKELIEQTGIRLKPIAGLSLSREIVLAYQHSDDRIDNLIDLIDT